MMEWGEWNIMKRIKIITIYDPNPNYGNRLQNYAVQTVLEKLGCLAQTLSFQKNVMTGKKRIKLWLMRLSGYHLPGDKLYWKYYPKKLKRLRRFNRKYIRTEKVHSIDGIGRADYYVLGSNQVWNPVWYTDCGIKKDIYLLTFAKPEQKVCISPSFGVDALPKEWKPWFKEHLLSFPMLSVREEAGARIIKELTGRDALVTIDPTLMLDKEDWRKISAKPSGVDCEKTYILTYFLGKRLDGMDQVLDRFSKQIGAEAVYHLMDTSQPELYVADPSEFIYLIDHAALVLTDSFHACVFSFLFGKPFLCYDRLGSVDAEGNDMNMGSRMQTLFDKFDLERKHVGGRCGMGEDITENLLECDYSSGWEALEWERGKLIDFLKKAMRLEEI